MFESRFQTFDESSDPSKGAERIAALRQELARLRLDGFIVLRGDEHQNEYVPPSAERLRWLTGFSGSAGTAIVLARDAAIFVDGRYTLQVHEQVDSQSFAILDSGETKPQAWLQKHAETGSRIGYDSWLLTPSHVADFEAAAKAAGAQLVAVARNPLDAIWADRPAIPKRPIDLHPPRLAGERAPQKLARVRAEIGGDTLLLSDPHAIAWAFNLRGHDVSHTPIALAFALVTKDTATLYIDPDKLTPAVREGLAPLATLRAPDALVTDLDSLGRNKATVRFDPKTAPAFLVQRLEHSGGTATIASDPILLMKARKNATELKGSRAAHLRDGVAMVRFLAWFEAAVKGGALTEIDAAQALEEFRRETKKLKDLSFPTISAAGPTPPCPIIASPNNRTDASNRESFCSIPARNIKTGRPTSPARSPSAERRR